MAEYVEVDGQRFVDDGEGNPKVDESGNPIPFVPEQTVPYSRFKEVNETAKKYKEELESLKSIKPAQQKTPAEIDAEARRVLKNISKEALEEVERERKEQERAEQKEFDEKVSDILAQNADVKRAEFLEFIEKNADKYKIESVEGAMLLYRDLNSLRQQVTEETIKKAGLRPGFLKNESGAAPDYSEVDKGKSMSQIVREVTKGLKS